MVNKVKIQANKGGIRYLGTWSIVPREVREKLASYKPTIIDASFLSFMEPSSYEFLENIAEEKKVVEPIIDEKTEDIVKEEVIVKPKPKHKKKKSTKSTLDPSTEEEIKN